MNPRSVLAEVLDAEPGCVDCGFPTGHHCTRCDRLVCWGCYNEEHFCDD